MCTAFLLIWQAKTLELSIVVKDSERFITFQGGVTSMPPVVPFAFTINDQEITDNCRHAQIYNNIHIITWKYTDMYRENGRFDRQKLALIP